MVSMLDEQINLFCVVDWATTSLTPTRPHLIFCAAAKSLVRQQRASGRRDKRKDAAGKQFLGMQDSGTQVRVRAGAKLCRNNEHMAHATGLVLYTMEHNSRLKTFAGTDVGVANSQEQR